MGCYPDIKWHYIGNLQSNKTNALASMLHLKIEEQLLFVPLFVCLCVLGIPNLWMVESISSIRMAEMINRVWKFKNPDAPLKVLVQVNTAEEPSKIMTDGRV